MPIGTPLIDTGTLNKVRGSIVIPNYPNLNVTASFLGKDGISTALEGNVTEVVEVMCGIVPSPNVYQMVTATVHLLKTQALAAAYRAQVSNISLIGPFNIISDATEFADYNVLNGSIGSIREISMNGTDPGYVLTLRGYVIINNNLWSLTG